MIYKLSKLKFTTRLISLGVVFDKRITWRLHIEIIEANAFRTFIRIYSLFRSEWLSAIIKLILHKALIRSMMTYACPDWEFAADTHLMKLQCLRNKGLRTTGKFPRPTPVRDLHMAYQLSYAYNYIAKLCSQEAEIIQNHGNANTQSKAENISGLNLVAVNLTTVTVTRLLSWAWTNRRLVYLYTQRHCHT
jgi:hypothetical protein